MIAALLAEIRKGPPPWGFLFFALVAVLTQAIAPWQTALIYERTAIESGEWWRIWTGNYVHFGWLHCIVDTGLFVIVGWVIERSQPLLSRIGLVLMPLAVSGTLYYFDPAMNRYAGLSGLNVGFLVFLACLGWQNSRRDWFWPAVLALHVVEVLLEAFWGHGMVVFNDPTVRVATSAHVGGLAFGLALWGIANLRRPRVAVSQP